MKYRAVACLLFLTMAEYSYGVITPISSSINLHAESNAGAGLIQDDDSAGQTTGLNGLSASVFAQALNGTLKATSQSTASAAWTSASAGQFSLHTELSTDDLGSFSNSRVATGGLAWRYMFTSDSPATFTLNYQVTHNLPYPWGLALTFGELIDHSGFQTIQGPQIPVPSSGLLSFSIVPGRPYAFTLYDGSNLNHYLPAFDSEMTGTFSFQITPVPEPGPFAFFIGFGMTCVLLRNSTSMRATCRGR